MCRCSGSDSYSPGAQCHDKKYLKCLKIPKHEEYDKCEDIIDTTYIEECDEVLETHCEKEFAHVTLVVHTECRCACKLKREDYDSETQIQLNKLI